MILDPFPVSHSRPLQIIQYGGPPEPKHTSRRNPSKPLSNADDSMLRPSEAEVIDVTQSSKHS